MKKTLIAIALLTACVVGYGQDNGPRPSPASTVSADVGKTTIKIDYFRPKMKGRKIFGEGTLVPFGKIWRTGANSGTKISFSEDVTVEGVKVPKGEYLLLTWPGASEWTVSLYKDASIGGDMSKYKAENDAAKFKVKPTKLTEPVETFTIGVSDLSEDSTSGNIQLSWEKTSVKFKVVVPKNW